MTILIVSSNPLFKEVIVEAVSLSHAEFIELSPEQALNSMCEIKPDVLIIDETITLPQFEHLLAKARAFTKTRTIVLNPIENEILLLDIRRTKLRKTEDLIKVISSSQTDGQLETEDKKFEIAAETAKNYARVISFLTANIKKPPDANFVSLLRTIWIDQIAGIDRMLETNRDIRIGIRMISQFLQTTTEISDEALADVLKDDWICLYGAETPANQGTPHEARFLIGVAHQEELLEHLAWEYAQGGMQIKEDDRASLDSLATEMSFLGSLAGQAAAALDDGDLELTRKIEGQVVSFFQEHLGKWAGEYLSQAITCPSTGYYQGFIQLFKGLLASLDDIDRALPLP